RRRSITIASKRFRRSRGRLSMSENHPRRLAALRRILVSWYTPAAIGLCLLLALAMWALPRPIERTVTDPATGKGQTVTTWDTSRWQALTAVWGQVLLLALVLLALLADVWAGRGRVLRAAAAARFFAASLLIHCLLVLWLCAVPLARAVVERAEDIRISQAAQLFEESAKPAEGGGRSAFEKLADLRAEDKGTPNLARQAPAPVDVPGATDPLAPTIPAHAVRSLPPERLLFVPPRQPDVVGLPQEIERRNPAHARKPVEARLDMPELPPPEDAPKEKPLDTRPVAQQRQEPAVPAPAEQGALRLPELQRPRSADLRPEVTDPPPVREERQTPDPLTGRRQTSRVLPAAPREREAQPNADPS